MNLACKAVLDNITDMDCASEESDVAAVTYVPANTFCETIEKDPIAVIRNVIRIVSIYFSHCTLSEW